MTITVGSSRAFSNWHADRVRGEKGLGIHRLLLDLQFIGPGGPPETVMTDLIVLVSASGSGGGGYVGCFRPVEGCVTLPGEPQGWTRQVEFFLDMDAERVEAIESVRRGGPLRFRLDLRGRLLSSGRFHQIFDEREYVPDQGLWIKALEQLGYRRYLLLEVPIPSQEIVPHLSEPVMHFEKAQNAALRGEWREAVGCGRDVLESLALALGDRDDQDEEANALFNRTRLMDVEGRLRVVRRALRILTHPSRHADQSASQIEWEQRDAKTVLAAVGALLSRYGAQKP